MHDAAAFLRDIRRRPHDDAPRLIFADWLEENGDPRGEFIRLQCLRSADGVGDDRRALLLRREQALLKQHKAQWTGPLQERGIRWEFRRGLLRLWAYSHEFPNLDWAGAAASEAWQWVETTAIVFTRPTDAALVAESPALGLMEALDLRGNALGVEGVRRLAMSPYLSRLRSLDLSFNRIEAATPLLALCPGMPRLVALKLDDNHLGDWGAVALVGTMPTPLETLSLRWNTIGPDGAWALAESAALHRLAVLHLGNNSVGDEGALALAQAAGLPRLTELRLEYNGVGAAAAAALRRRFGDGVHL